MVLDALFVFGFNNLKKKTVYFFYFVICCFHLCIYIVNHNQCSKIHLRYAHRHNVNKAR